VIIVRGRNGTACGEKLDRIRLACFARGIERRLAELPRGQSIPPHELPAIAFTHAGALLSLLAWWLDRGMREPPEEMDKLFHRMVWNGVSSK